MSQTGSLWEKRRVKWLNTRTPSRWMFALNTDGDIEAHDGVRVRAIIIHKISNPRSRRWCVFRRYHDGNWAATIVSRHWSEPKVFVQTIRLYGVWDVFV